MEKNIETYIEEMKNEKPGKHSFSINIDISEKYSELGKAIQEKNFGEALRYLEKSIKLDPYNYQLWLFMGMALSGLKKNKKALESFDRAIEIMPEAIEAFHSKGILILENLRPLLDTPEEVLSICNISNILK